jgi:hypothetical protein
MYKACLSYPLRRRFGGPHSRFGEKKYLLPLQEIEQRFLGRPECSIPAPVLHYATYIKSRAKMDPFGMNRQRCAGTCANWTEWWAAGRAIYLSTAH